MRRDEISEVLPGIWRVRVRGVSSYIVKLSPGAVLVDAGPETSGTGVMMGMQRARVGLSSLRAVLLTSRGAEAVRGLPTLQRRAGAPVYGPAEPHRFDAPIQLPIPVQPLSEGDRVAHYFRAVEVRSDEGTACYYFEPARALFLGHVGDRAPSGLDIAASLASVG